MANHYHLALLQQGTNIWNEWKMTHPYHLSDFSGADLTGMNLKALTSTRRTLQEPI